MVLNLALRIAPGFGKTPSPDTRIAAGRAMNLLTKRRLSLQPMVMDTGAIPAGAGYYPGDTGVSNIYLQQPEDTLDDVSGPIGLE
jgi:hypothetical protein